MYDSNCNEYELDSIFAMYTPKGRHLLESYEETEEESNYLSKIPKIFVLDMCRGDVSAKPIKFGQGQKGKENEKEKEKEKETEKQQQTETETETKEEKHETEKESDSKNEDKSNNNNKQAQQQVQKEH